MKSNAICGLTTYAASEESRQEGRLDCERKTERGGGLRYGKVEDERTIKRGCC